MTNKTENKKSKEGTRKRGFSRSVTSVLNGNFLTREFVQTNLTFIFFLVGMMICYIGYGYFAEKNLKTLVSRQSELNELKARNLAVHARLEQLKQQSQIARSISDLGLKESTSPPTVIRVEDLSTYKSGGE
jgi:hypothetical protein